MPEPTPKQVSQANPVTDFIQKLAQIPGIDKLKGILNGVNLGLGGQQTSQSELTGDVYVNSSRGLPWYVWAAVAAGAFFYWRKK